MSATDLCDKLDDLIIELDRLDITLDSPANDMTVGEYEQEREKLLDEFIQVITATLREQGLGCSTRRWSWGLRTTNCGSYAGICSRRLAGAVLTAVRPITRNANM